MSLPPAITLAAIGQATARALADMGLSADLLPEAGENSEGLLARLAALDLTHRQVVILRGQSGRELLARELGQRGARVTQISCYRRGPVASPPLDHFRRWLDLPEGVVTITSVAILETLLGAVTPTDRTALLHRPVVTLSDRIRDVCRQSGFTGPIAVARGTDPENICQAIRETRDVSDPG